MTIGAAERAYLQQARMFVTNGTSLSASPARETTREALRTAREAGLRTVFDVDYRASSWPSPEEAGRVARDVLSCVDVVLGNEEEREVLTSEREPHGQVQAVLGSGVGLVVRKRGARGVEAHTREQVLCIPPCPTRVVSAIGAGDGFAAGFLYALYLGLPLSECPQYGHAAAAIVVSRVSFADAMPYREEPEKFFHAHRPQE